MSISIEPIKQHIGGVVRAKPAELLEPGVAPVILDALEERGVLVFPGVDMDDAQQLAFTESLGTRSKYADNKHLSRDGTPGVYKVTLEPGATERPEYIYGTFFWHMDGMPVIGDVAPPRATLLSARRNAAKGGQTEFCNTVAAYAALDPELKAEIADLRVVHSIYAGVRPTISSDEEEERSRRESVERERPLVWTQPSGRKSLIIGHTADRVVGMSIPEGRALLERLMEWSAQPDFSYRHDWRVGDLVIWYNSGVLHRVVPYSETSGRLMHRTSLAGVEAIA
jgi:alpha-ketoglutarate-dependent taurine dioxygenase